MRVAIGSDHAGFALKEAIKAFVAGEHGEVLDVGTHGSESVDYPDYAAAVGAALREHRADRGIILCGSGVGASMAANRIPGIRAGLCHDTYSAHQGVEHDDMNVLVLGGRVVGSELARELVEAFLNARFSGEGRHLRRRGEGDRARESAACAAAVRTIGLARLHPAQPAHERRTAAPGRRGRRARRHLESRHLREGDDRQLRLRATSSRRLAPRRSTPPRSTRRLPVRDIQQAADVLRAVYDETARRDGYVSLEVSPLLAADTAGTLAEARRLWAAVGRPNLMIKVPGTPEGIAAVRQLIAEGINVNVTLLFAQDAYERAAEAYIDGLEALVARGGDPSGVASVASFFVSRIDTAIDAALDARLAKTADAAGAAVAAGAPRQGGDRQREARVPAVSGAVQRAALARAGRARRADATAPLGQHGNQERQLPRRGVRRGADRARHRQHDAAADARGLPGSRPSSREPCRGPRRRLRHDAHAGRRGHLAERDDRRAAGRRHRAFHRRVPEAAGGRRAAEPRNRRHTHPAALLARAAARVRDGGERVAGRLADAGQRQKALGARLHALDRTRRGAMARVADHHQRPTGAPAAVRANRARRPGARACPTCSSSAWAARPSAPRC